MRKRWMHHELKAMKEAGPSDREVENGLVLGIRLEGTSRLGTLSFDLLFAYPIIPSMYLRHSHPIWITHVRL